MKFKCEKSNRYGIKVGEIYHYNAFQTTPNLVEKAISTRLKEIEQEILKIE